MRGPNRTSQRLRYLARRYDRTEGNQEETKAGNKRNVAWMECGYETPRWEVRFTRT
jgi:hypothetical protein